MANQKGLNKNRNHHDNLSNSGSNRFRHDSRSNKDAFELMASVLTGGKTRPYGEGKHNKGSKPKQKHW